MSSPNENAEPDNVVNADPQLNTVVSISVSDKEFEDKFLRPKTIVPLDDSEQYVAALERKLTKLKRSKKDPRRELLQAVEDTRNAYMIRVISSKSREVLNIN